MTTAPGVAVFCMEARGHLQRLLPLIRELSSHGVAVYVFTHESFRADVERSGGAFVDMLGKYSLDLADSESVPRPCRFVSFAARYAEPLAAEVRALGARLVVYDTFAVVGRVVASVLGLPCVNVCSGHNVDPARFVPNLQAELSVAVSASCERAVRTLQERYGFPEASPFWYVGARSPFLNLYCEPEAYLSVEERRSFEPVAFFGSLPAPDEMAERQRRRVSCFGGERADRRVYVSFGTIIWRYYANEALRALHAVSNVLGASPNTRGLMSLGGARIEEAQVSALAKSNVRVADYVDQWSALAEADVFVTHHGLNSTHEAIAHRVPMISYPFFGDQPDLAKKCREFELAVPLGDVPRAPIDEHAVRRALDEVSRARASLDARLERARGWELATIAGRGKVIRSVLDLMAP